MKRRNFIKFTIFYSFLISSTNLVAKTFNQNEIQVLKSIFNIIFPKTKNMPSAKEFKAVEYLITNISHKTFDDEDKSFLVQAIKDFNSSFPEFLSLNKKKKEELIFSIIQENDYANNFISKLTYYGIEAMFSDPIYGGNHNKIVWNSVNHYYGRPRPKSKYGKRYDI